MAGQLAESRDEERVWIDLKEINVVQVGKTQEPTKPYILAYMLTNTGHLPVSVTIVSEIVSDSYQFWSLEQDSKCDKKFIEILQNGWPNKTIDSVQYIVFPGDTWPYNVSSKVEWVPPDTKEFARALLDA